MLALGAVTMPLAGQVQPTVPAGPDEAENAVIVTGTRDRDRAVQNFVEQATVETNGQIARLQAPVCPLSIGLPADHNAVIEARMREVAEQLGIGGGSPGCRPNVVVVVAERGGDFVRLLRRERPELFGALELAELRRILRLEGPVRAWQIVEPRGADGRPIQRISFIESPGGPPRPVARGYHLAGVMPSLTSRSTRQDVSLSFVVFDLGALEGLTLLQIADHAAMRAFARTVPPLLPAGRSILTLFADGQAGAATGLTRWDAAYLGALYRTGGTLSAHGQRAGIARSMRRALETGP